MILTSLGDSLTKKYSNACINPERSWESVGTRKASLTRRGAGHIIVENFLYKKIYRLSWQLIRVIIQNHTNQTKKHFELKY